MKFMGNDVFQVEDFKSAVRTTAIAQDLEFDNSSYPTESIARNSHRLRNLGMGYANLGALIMSLTLPYDSPEARAVAASITALQTGIVYETSAEMAEKIGPFKEFEKNKIPMLNVMGMHRDALDKIDRSILPKGLEAVLDEAYATWDRVVEKGEKYGFRNAQATVLAPTGTIGYFMDCDTLGIEPEIGLVQIKLLADGAGVLRRVNGMVESVLTKLKYNKTQISDIKNYIAGHQELEGTPHLKSENHDLVERIRKSKVTISNGKDELEAAGYNNQQIKDIMDYLDGHKTMEGAPHIQEEHLAIFDCSNKPSWAKRSISAEGHVNMMASVQPFISGAISKTVNMPKESSIEDIERIYREAHQKGIKSIAIYRDGSKGVQVLSFGEGGLEEKVQSPVRRKLPITSNSIRHKFSVVGHEGYLHVGLYKNGIPGELFITMSKEGSTIGGLMDAFATSTSINLQYGVPLETLVKKFRHQRFEPSGMVYEGHPEIKTADSIIDYIFTWMGKQFLPDMENGEGSSGQQPKIESPKASGMDKNLNQVNGEEEMGGFCMGCGNQMTKRGNCEQICMVCNHQDLTGCGGS